MHSPFLAMERGIDARMTSTFPQMERSRRWASTMLVTNNIRLGKSAAVLCSDLNGKHGNRQLHTILSNQQAGDSEQSIGSVRRALLQRAHDVVRRKFRKWHQPQQEAQRKDKRLEHSDADTANERLNPPADDRQHTYGQPCIGQDARRSGPTVPASPIRTASAKTAKPARKLGSG